MYQVFSELYEVELRKARYRSMKTRYKGSTVPNRWKYKVYYFS